MADSNTFIFRSDWLDHLTNLDSIIQAKIVYDITAYGCGREPLFADDPVVTSMVNFVRGSIDFSKDKYEAKTHGGTKKRFRDSDIYDVAHKIYIEKGKVSASEVKDILGCGLSTVNNSAGWKARYQDTFTES